MTEWMTGNDGVQVGRDDFGHVLIRNSADSAECLVFVESEFAEFLAAAKAGNLDHFVTDADDLIQLESTDEWDRPRCQEIIRYVDTLEPVQCGMTEDHDGACDPLPITPDIEPQDEQEPNLLTRMIEEINTNPITRRAFGRLAELDRRS